MKNKVTRKSIRSNLISCGHGSELVEKAIRKTERWMRAAYGGVDWQGLQDETGDAARTVMGYLVECQNEPSGINTFNRRGRHSCSRNSDFLGDEAYVEETVSDFNRTVAEGDWLYTWDEDGSFEIISRTKAFETYILRRWQGETTDHFVDYRGAKKFTQAKLEVVSALSAWAERLRSAVQFARAYKKPKE